MYSKNPDTLQELQPDTENTLASIPQARGATRDPGSKQRANWRGGTAISKFKALIDDVSLGWSVCCSSDRGRIAAGFSHQISLIECHWKPCGRLGVRLSDQGEESPVWPNVEVEVSSRRLTVQEITWFIANILLAPSIAM
ncbi:hypothetical protein NPIL_232261 [Nephila pilipes]|uniref:Uncharacterized protein n=1 Tax=Nephila pilipes TaxID=299642 RepID=A0A8X6NEA7_NEPPI|nr:hypothetical protein NPIL_232261 [Nephila pilipes]